MKALTVLSPGNGVIAEVPKPVPAPNQLVIKVVRAGICATDLAIFSGDCSFVRDGSITYPARIGHEWSGVVESVGAAVKGFKPGDRVICDNGVSCGECPDCKTGRYGDCRFNRSVGTINCWEGCFAEYMLMPEYHVYHIADDVTFDNAALIEPLSIAYACFKRNTITPDMTVAVIGSGAIGMSAVALAHCFGAGKVVCVARKEMKLAIAKRVGATEVVNNTKEDAVAAVRAMTDGLGADLVVETSGAEQGLRQAILMTRKHGVIEAAGFFEREIGNVPIDTLVIGEMQLRGAAGCYGNVEACRDLMAKHHIDMSPIVTHRVKFPDMLEMLVNQRQYTAERVKVMVDFD